MKPMNLPNYTFEVNITREQLLTYVIHYILNIDTQWTLPFSETPGCQKHSAVDHNNLS